MSPLPSYEYYVYAAAAYGDKIYVISKPQNVTAYQHTWAYNTLTDSWEQKAQLTNVRQGIAANVADGKIYVISGQAISAPQRTPWPASEINTVYDPETDSWSTAEPILVPVMYYASAVVDGKIYIIGGEDPMVDDVTVDLVQIFDPQTGEWSQGSSMPKGVYCTDACATSGEFAPQRIYVVGGSYLPTNGNLLTYTNLTQIYDPRSDSWTTGADMPTARTLLSVSCVDDAVYAIGGLIGYEACAANERYLPIGYEVPSSPSPQNSANNPSPSPSIPEFPFLMTLPMIAVISAFLGVLLKTKGFKITSNSKSKD